MLLIWPSWPSPLKWDAAWLSIYHELVSLANAQPGPDSAIGVCITFCTLSLACFGDCCYKVVFMIMKESVKYPICTIAVTYAAVRETYFYSCTHQFWTLGGRKASKQADIYTHHISAVFMANALTNNCLHWTENYISKNRITLAFIWSFAYGYLIFQVQFSFSFFILCLLIMVPYNSYFSKRRRLKQIYHNYCMSPPTPHNPNIPK